MKQLWIMVALLLINNGALAKGLVMDLAKAPKATSPSGAVVKFLAGPELGNTKSAFIAHLSLPAKAKIPIHRDSTEEYLFVLSGSGTIWINKQKFEIKPNQLIYMPAKAEVKFEADDNPVNVIQIFAPPGPEDKYKNWK